MKKYTLLFVLLYAGSVLAQSVNLPAEARFSFGDDMAWASPAFNDAAWARQPLGKGFTKDSSYCWYRIKVIIPSALRSVNGKGLKLNLGKIDDADQTFFNGKQIGAMGSFPPAYTTQWDKPRVYIIPANEIKWDKENLVAVRVYNLTGGMGMWAADPYYTIEPVGWMDEVTVKQEFRNDGVHGFVAVFSFTNKTNSPFNGTVTYQVNNKDKSKILFTETKRVQLKGEVGNETVVTSTAFKPGNEHVYKVGYQVNDDASELFLKKEQLYIAAGNLSIPVLPEAKPLVQNKVSNNFTSVPFQNQQYNGYLGTRFRQNLEQRLLKVDEAGLLGSYLNRPGIHPWQGEHVGKYLEAACNVWKLTHDTALKKQMDRMMFTLINTQLEDGYLGTYTVSQYWTSWDVWSHKYNLHGLLAYYAATGYKPALAACKKMGDLLCRTFGNNAGQRDIILAGEHVGMAATSVLGAMVDLYRYTADKKYLDFCYYITGAWEQKHGPHIISAILKSGRVTDVGNRKAYEMLSNYVGLVKLYQLTGNVVFLEAVEAAWKDVVKNRLYITGTASEHEYFQEDGVLPAGADANMGEGCVTTTWIQLNQNLFAVTGDIKYLNQLETSVYNHLLAAEDPQTGCVSYYTPLMDKKPFTCFITCCQSSVPRGIALVPDFTFGNIKNIATILFYEPASYKVKIAAANKKNINAAFIIDGNFPESGKVTITVNTNEAAIFPVALRVPEWCTGYTAHVGGKVYTAKPDEFITISKNWKPGEKINVTFDMPVQQLAGGKSYPGQVAFKRGPQVLAVDRSLNTAPAFEFITRSKENIIMGEPTAAGQSNILPANWIGKQVYFTDILNKNEKLYLVPFADASQTGADMKVWLQAALKKK